MRAKCIQLGPGGGLTRSVRSVLQQDTTATAVLTASAGRQSSDPTKVHGPTNL